MIKKRMPRLLFFGLILLIFASVISAIAAANSVPATRLTNQTTPVTTATKLFISKPSECAALTLTDILYCPACGGTKAAELILGTANGETINAGGGDDCVVGGAGNDNLGGGAGNDVLIGGPGADVMNGGNGTDTCYGSVAEGDTITCEIILPSP